MQNIYNNNKTKKDNKILALLSVCKMKTKLTTTKKLLKKNANKKVKLKTTMPINQEFLNNYLPIFINMPRQQQQPQTITKLNSNNNNSNNTKSRQVECKFVGFFLLFILYDCNK